jgi:hypothetical protein
VIRESWWGAENPKRKGDEGKKGMVRYHYDGFLIGLIAWEELEISHLVLEW